MGTIDFGIYIPQLQFTFDDIRARVEKAEELGYSNVWFMDHLYPPFLPDVPSLEAWTLASAIAPLTEKIRIGHMVLDNAFRHPALLAKMASSLDVISNGRLEIGLGTGSYPQEHPEYGIPFPGARERTERLEESIDVLKRLFTQERTTFKGKFIELNNAPNLPKPIQSPHPPIWIGGAGPKLTLPLVARKADVWNAPTSAAAAVEEKIGLLKEECVKIGRDASTLRLTLEAVLVIVPKKADIPDALASANRRYGGPGYGVEAAGYVGTPDMVTQRIEQVAKAGITHFTWFFYDRAKIPTIELFGKEVIPAFS